MADLSILFTPIDTNTCQVDWTIRNINVAACSWAGIADRAYSDLPSSNYLDYFFDVDYSISGSGSTGICKGSFYIYKTEHPWAISFWGAARSIGNDTFYGAGSALNLAPVYAAPPEIDESTKTENSIVCQVINLNTNYSNGGREINWYLSQDIYQTMYVSDGSSTSGYQTFSNLSPLTNYRIDVDIWYNTYPGAGYDAYITLDPIFITTLGSSRPSNFSWTNSKISGGNFNLTAIEWNALTTRINQFRTYKSMSSYTFTSASSNPGSNIFTAAMFNQARTAIGQISGSGTLPNAVNIGDTVMASSLNQLVSALNAIS